MKNSDFDKQYEKVHNRRYQKILEFMDSIVNSSDNILDLGPNNPFSDILVERGFNVKNTPENMDLDLEYDIVDNSSFDLVTAFEILEHLVSPFPLLRAVKAPKLLISVPLRLWFATAYWNEDDPKDRHYHEFEPRQLDMLLEKAGWQIKKKEKWILPVWKLGIRPFLRNITPRYYFVYCERKPTTKQELVV